MGEALIRGFLRAKVSTPSKICCSVKDWERRDALERLGIGSIFGDATESGAEEVARFARIVFLCTKPQACAEVLQSMAPHMTPDHLVVSIAAGITINTLEEGLGHGTRVVRVMPNTPALVQSGASAYALGTHATPHDAELVDLLLGSVGFCIRVEEKQLDAVTGLSGSGPAFVYLVIEALADGGVAAGLPRDTALALAAKTVAGAAQMVFSEDETSVLGMVHPGVLKDRVASPAGTTIAGLTELESSGVRGAFIRAVTRAAQRSKELAG
ncbi:pyrroline-5-carboxylate reductase [Micractinium conductrix]|uniref:Pyrroline-5-carboxylate reductase n=1 Tax=Micractinium conductrix TaxID=554055 RepID=A0A2P6VNI4_9CHLO|nr:pyrroline-5-carboxylate reductase [Micractinium conductrix]|eukprot:PSC75658.1 pyrroline-5-carboxylate reductase [Micractinium conductrix]